MTDTRPYSQRQKMSAPTQDALRAQAINSAMAVLDDPLFKALQEPSRVAVLRQLMLLGRADVGQIAEKLPQERSVISRHLQLLLEAGIVRMERAGRSCASSRSSCVRSASSHPTAALRMAQKTNDRLPHIFAH